MFDEIGFPREPMIGAMILRIIGFVAIKIINFDPAVTKVGDVAMNMQHSRFHIQVIEWLKTKM
jgi:hypothetical protein